MKKMGVLKNNGRLMGVTKIPRKSPFNPKKLQKKAPIGKKLAKKKENRLMVGAMKSAFFFNGHSQKKRRDLYLPIFWKLIFWRYWELEFDFPYTSVEEVKFCMQTCKRQVGEGWGRVRVRQTLHEINVLKKNEKQNAYLTQYFLTLYLFPLQQDFF